MPRTSLFTPCGMLSLTSAPSEAALAYTAITNDLNDAFDLTPGTYYQARCYAMAMMVGRARKMIKRVPRELHPLTSHDLLTTLEKDWACIPQATDTLYERQLRVAARKALMRGSREEALVTDLTAALGTDFLKVNAIAAGSAANYPTTATDAGTFPNPNLAPKFYQLGSVPVTGAPYTTTWKAVNGSAAPLVGEIITCEPDIAGWAEAVTVTGVTTTGGLSSSALAGTITATWARAHSANSWAVTAAPLWLSNRYQITIVVSDAASKNGPKRQAVHGVMRRHAKSCERWKIVAASSSTQVGPFIFGAGKNYFGATAVGSAAVNF